jgi:hypothetical protein
LPAGLDEGTDIVDPRALVEIHREKPARLIGEERIDAHDVSARQMPDYGRVVERNECLVQAIAAFDLRQFTYAPNELVAARGGVPTLPCSRAHKSGREDVLAPAKQGAEEPNLFGRRAGC